VEDLSRTTVRMLVPRGGGSVLRRGALATIALTLGLAAMTACSIGVGGPVEPSPGIDTEPPVANGTESVPVTPGPGITKPGIRLIAVPRSDGTFDITEDVLLPSAMNILQVQLPESGKELPGMMARTIPKATNLKITADNQSVPLGETTLSGAADIPLTTAATRVRLTYKLSGSTVRTTPSKPERASTVIRPLASASEGTLPASLSVTSGLLNAVCPLLTDTRCAVGDPPKLAIMPEIPASKALVVLQLNLPRDT
jgi:hypothetical protein